MVVHVKVSQIAKRYMTWRLYKPLTPLFSQGVFWEWVRSMDFYMVSKQVPWTMMDLFLPMLNTCLTKKLPHVRRHIKVSHIAKRYMTWEFYKSWCSLLSQGVFWDWVRPIRLLHGIRSSGSWTMLGLPFHCTRVWTIVSHVKVCVKSLTFSRYAWVVGFISLEQTPSFKVPFVEE